MPAWPTYLWAAPAQRDGISIEHGWMGRHDARNFAGLVEYTDDFLPGARRYDVGEFGDFMAMPMLEAALDQLNEWGVDNIAATMADFTGRIESAAAALGLLPAPQKSRVPHLIGVRFPDGVPVRLLEHLRASGVYVSLRGDSMRVAPYLYNTDEDIDRLFSVVADLV